MKLTRRKYMFLSGLVMAVLLIFSSMPVFAEDLGSWITKNDMPTSRSKIQSATINGKIYVFGGENVNGYLSTVELFDPINNTWSNIKNMPAERNAHSVATVNDKAYIISGQNKSGQVVNSVFEYDYLTDSWTTKANIPTARVNASTIAVNGKIYVIGGEIGGTWAYSNKVEEYDPASNTWTTKADLPIARSYCGITEVNGKIYVIGGYKGGTNYLNTVEEYNVETNTWVTKANMPTSRRFLGVIALNSKIYAIGGENANGGYYSIVEEYNPLQNSWSTMASMPTARCSFAIGIANNKIYTIGGLINSTSPYNNVVQEYTPPMVMSTAPTNLTATAGNAKVDLSWTAVTGATGYNVKRSSTAGGPYTLIETSSSINYTDTTVTNGTTYYYVVTAITANGESANSNEASATPQAPASTGKALLVITMVNGTEKEYELSMTEINAFIDWYDIKETGTGKAYYVFDKKYNKANFLSRKDYIVFDKIRDFEVMQYE